MLTNNPTPRTLTLNELRYTCYSDAKLLIIHANQQPHRLNITTSLLTKATRLLQLETQQYINYTTGQPYEPVNTFDTIVENPTEDSTLAAAINVLKTESYPDRLNVARSLLLSATDAYNEALKHYQLIYERKR
jgi:hypothetical protein